MSIISKARELLDKYKGTASSALNYFNPTSNQGNNFWGSKPIQNYAKTNTAQFVQGAGEGLNRVFTPYVRLLGEAAYQGGRKIIDPKFQNQKLPTTMFLKPEQINTPYKTIGTGVAATSKAMLGTLGVSNPLNLGVTAGISGLLGYGTNRLSGGTPQQAWREAGQSAGYSPIYAGINKITGGPSNVISETLLGGSKKLLPNILVKGLTTGGVNVLENIAFTPLTELRSTTKQENVVGFLTGFFGTAVSETGGTIFRNIASKLAKLHPDWTPAQIDTSSRQYIRDKFGRFAKQMSGLKGKMPDEVNWGKKDLTQVAPSKFVATEKLPEYYKELDKALNVPKDFDIKKINLGLGIKDVRGSALDAQAKVDAQAGLYDTKPIRVFRGTTSKEIGIPREGLSTSAEKSVAQRYASARGPQAFVDELYIDPKAKIIKGSDIPNEVRASGEGSDFMGKAAIWAKKNGYDVIDARGEGMAFAEQELRVLNPDVLKTKAQLDNVAQQPFSVAETPMTPVRDIVTKKAGLLDRKLPQSGEIATKELQNQELSTKKPQVEGAGAGRPSSTNIITDPVQKVISLLEEAKPMNEKQLELYKAERSRRAGAIAGIGKNIKGEKGFYTQLGALKGELPKVQFERIRNGLKQADIDSLFNKVESANITPFEKITAKTGLSKLLGAEGGQIPVKSEMRLLSEIFPPEFINAIQAKRPFIQRLWSGIEGALNLPRAIMATADLSAPLRQGFFFVSRPKQWLPAFKDMFKYAGSEKAYLGLMDDIKTRPNYLKMRESKLALTDMSPNILAREEEFMSTLAEKIPGFGILAKGSNRAYSGFLNKLRADVFDDLVNKAEIQGIKMDSKVLQDLASFINSATGRGNLGKTMQKAAPILNGAFFSPRLMASRINLLNPATYVKYDPFVRKEAVKSLIGTGTIAMSILGLSKLAGAEVGTDPRSADFGKIKIGNTRYDILGGFQQYIKLMAQLASGQVVSSTTGKVITLGEGYKPLTRKDILMRFFEAKTSPVASFIISLITGQTGVGEPVNIPTEIINRFIPMMAQDIYDIAKDKDSIGKGLLMAIPGIFGAGSQTYGKSEYVEGENKIGQPTSQIRPVQGLAETISEKAFGKQPLGSSSTYNIQTFITQMKSMSPQEQELQWKRIVQTNPELAKKIKQVLSDEKKGITVQDQTLKAMGVASGDRATAIYKEFKKLKTKEEKARLWEDYVRKGIITKDVAKQLKYLLTQ